MVWLQSCVCCFVSSVSFLSVHAEAECLTDVKTPFRSVRLSHCAIHYHVTAG
jgi:hypothetical protein